MGALLRPRRAGAPRRIRSTSATSERKCSTAHIIRSRTMSRTNFAPISPLVTAPVRFFARNTLPAANLTELIAWLRANLNRASAGRATLPYHLVAALFQKETGTQFAIVPYRGGAPAVTYWPDKSIL